MKEITDERKQYAKVIARAWADAGYKERLLADPATVLKESGIEIPEGTTVRFVEQKENEIIVPLPTKPPAQLSEDDLALVAGGITSNIKTPGVY